VATGIIAPGTPAPEFTLKAEDGEDFTRESLLGRTTVLVFYPFAFSPVCTDQFQVYEEVLSEFTEQGATLYGVSCDASYSQTAFREKLGVSIQQLSDFEPKGAASKAFGAYFAPAGMATRAPGHRRPRGHRAVELGGRAPGRAARREPDLRRPGRQGLSPRGATAPRTSRRRPACAATRRR
jgi:peroxiredoxin (alkyl hydroperoxide reductase subunit C)